LLPLSDLRRQRLLDGRRFKRRSRRAAEVANAVLHLTAIAGANLLLHDVARDDDRRRRQRLDDWRSAQPVRREHLPLLQVLGNEQTSTIMHSID
jgi:hypothetical protein